MKKRLLAALLAMLIASAVTGCGKKDSDGGTSKKDGSAKTSSSETEKKDKEEGKEDAASDAGESKSEDSAAEEKESKADEGSKADTESTDSAEGNSEETFESAGESADWVDADEATVLDDDDAFKDESNADSTESVSIGQTVADTALSSLNAMVEAYLFEESLNGNNVPDMIISKDENTELYDKFKQYALDGEFTIEIKDMQVKKIWVKMTNSDGTEQESVLEN